MEGEGRRLVSVILYPDRGVKTNALTDSYKNAIFIQQVFAKHILCLGEGVRYHYKAKCSRCGLTVHIPSNFRC